MATNIHSKRYQTLTNPHKPSQTLTNPHKPSQIQTKSTQIHTDEMDQKVSLIKIYLCKYCDNEFSRADNLKRHMNKFCKNKIASEIEALGSQLALKERQLRLQKVNSKLPGTTTTQTIIGNNNNTTNNNITVNILPYEQTDVSHLTDRDYQIAFNRASMCVPQDPRKGSFRPGETTEP